MIRVERHGDVTRLRMSTWRSRSLGYEVSAFYTRGVLLDCGFPDAADELVATLDELRPAGAVITHAHEDHAGNVALLARRQIPLDIAADSLAELRAGRRIRAYRRYTWGQPRPFTESFVPFVTQSLEAIAAPGHARDHRVFWDPERETLFSADLWLGVHVKVTHHDEDPRQLVRDLRAAAALRPARMFDAHRGPVADPVNALLAKAEWMEQTIGAIERRIGEGWSDRAIVRGVLGGEEWAGWISRGEYARVNLVRNVRAGSPRARGPVAAA
ncbi:MAG: MBL fold metallo-hydrolase [Gemmatimonadaceae bacterium]|nr:MBL fold metallo-hydrolase [Gemmatimonadaceae bacterium]